MKVEHGDTYWNIDIPKVEKYYGAKFVGEFPVPTPFPDGDNYLDIPAAIFWRPENLRTANFSEYFGLINPEGKGKFTVFNAKYITNYIFNGLKKNNSIIYSRYRHDFRGFIENEEGGPYVDGGFDYFKYGGDLTDTEIVRLQVVEGIITELPPKEKTK